MPTSGTADNLAAMLEQDQDDYVAALMDLYDRVEAVCGPAAQIEVVTSTSTTF